MGTTPNYSLPTPNDGDQWNLVTDLDALALATDTAIKGVADSSKNASNITSGTLAVANGGTGATTVAGAQDSLRVGLVPISPTTVEKAGTGSTATANTLGQVTFSACTSLSLNGVFSSAYKNYRIIINIDTATNATDTYLRLRATTDNSATIYQSFWAAISGTAIQRYGNSSQTAAIIAYSGVSNFYGCAIDIHSPFASQKTSGGFNCQFDNAINIGGFWHNAATSFDGFTILPSIGSFGGTIQVFGYNE